MAVRADVDLEQRRSEHHRRLVAAALALAPALALEELLEVVAAQARELVGAREATVELEPSSASAPEAGAVTVPLVAPDAAVVGVLRVAGDLDAEDEAALARLARLAGAAVANARLVAGLRFKSALLEAEHETSVEGVLVVDPQGTILQFNRRFVKMWGIPDDVVESRSDEAALAAVESELADPEAFFARVAYLYEHPELESRDEIPLADGRVFDRYSAPLRDASGAIAGRVWFFRDVTVHKRTEAELRQRLDELGAVYRMADAVSRAGSLEAIFEAALDAIEAGLGARRASILLLDEEGVMRFRAWRGLSDGYRRAVEGHSPWPPEAVDPEPVVVADAEADAELEPILPVLRAEGIRALAFVPLVHRGRLVGKFMLYHGEPREFGPSEILLAQAIAGHLAAATERKRAEDALRASQNQLEVIFRSVADGISAQDRSGRLVFANDAAARLTGYASADELVAAAPQERLARFELLDEERRPLPVDELPGRQALETGEPADRLLGYRVKATGEERWSVVRATPLTGEDGGVELVINAFHDVTERKRAEDRLRFLSEASRLLSASLDVETTLVRLGRLAVPELADYCLVDMLAEDGVIRPVVLAHADPEREALLGELRRRYPPEHNERHPASRAIATGEPVLYERVSDADLRAAAMDDEHFALYRRLEPSSYLVVPLLARGRVIGAISLGTAESGRHFAAADVALAEELASRAAVAVDNALLYREARKAVERQEEGAALLEAIVEGTTDAIFVKDLEGRYLMMNSAAAAISGRTVEEAIGLTTHDVYGPWAAAIAEHDRAVAESGEWRTFEEQPLGPDGPTFLATKGPYRNAAGEVVGVIGVARDISERKRAELERERLYESERQARAEAERAAETVRRLADVTEAGLGHRGLRELLDELVERIAAALQVDTVTILLEEGGELVPLAARGLEESVRRGVRIPLGRGFAGRVAAERRPIAIEDLAEAEVVNPVLRESGVRSLLGAPLVVEGRAIGVVHVGLRSKRSFTAEDERLLQLVADRVAMGVDQARLFEAERAARERLAFLAEASTALASSLDYEETLAGVARLAVPKIADWCSIYVVEDDGSIRPLAAAHVDPDKVRWADELTRRFPIDPADDFGVAAVVRSGEPLLVPEVTGEMIAAATQDRPGYAKAIAEAGTRSVMLVPMRSRERVVGALTLTATDESGRVFGPDDLALAEELARRAAVAVENARLFREQMHARAEADRRAQAAQALEFIGDGVFLVDRDGLVRIWNPAAEAITGLSAEDVVGRRPEEAIPSWTTVALLVPVGTEAPGTRPETVPVEIGGHELWLSISGVAFADGTVYAFRDLTEERALERLKSDFVSTVSHELRTPLAAIYGAAMTLQRADVELGKDQREGMLAVVASESERLARIVNDVLWASRLESGALDVSIETCDPQAIAQAVVEAARAHLPDGIELTLAVEAGLPPVAADPDKVRQVLVNLVDNAIKYSPDGGSVDVAVEGMPRAVRFSVHDGGLGIPTSEHGRIFEKFYRLDPDLTRGVGGTGLGLYICRELVRRMDGRIWVSSSPGRGSTFAFELPVATPAEGGRSD